MNHGFPEDEAGFLARIQAFGTMVYQELHHSCSLVGLQGCPWPEFLLPAVTESITARDVSQKSGSRFGQLRSRGRSTLQPFLGVASQRDRVPCQDSAVCMRGHCGHLLALVKPPFLNRGAPVCQISFVTQRLTLDQVFPASLPHTPNPPTRFVL